MTINRGDTFSEQNMLFHEHAAWVMKACDELGRISQSALYLDRRYLTKEHRAANDLVAEWMQDANMTTWQDSVGNIWGRRASRVSNAKSFVFGSHMDTVINGGKYDGMLGVIAPIALVSLLNKLDCELPFNIDVVGFCDEEGTRFGTTLLGSKALTGKWQPEWADFKDEDGITMRQAMMNFGLNFDDVIDSKLNAEQLLGYVETHIEQGPVLERHNFPVGTVTAIAGAKRINFKIEGMAGHAGTVPMENRHDALVGASEMILAVERCAKEAKIVATVGHIVNAPNAVNVIPGKTEFSLDIRSDKDTVRDLCLDKILHEFQKIADKRKLIVELHMTHNASAIDCSERIVDHLCKASVNSSLSGMQEPFTLHSGAGHDAMAMAGICDSGMLFVRCKKGISHHPAEAIEERDVSAVLGVLHEFITNFEA